MKLTTNAKSLSAAVAGVAKVVNTHSTVPVLQNVVLRASKGVLLLTATDLETTIEHRLDAEVEKDGVTTVPAKLLASYVSALPGGELVSIKSSGKGVAVAAGTSKVQLNTLPVDDFPALPNYGGESTLIIDGGTLAKSLSGTLYAAARNNPSPALGGVLLEITAQHLRAVATDGYRLAVAEHVLEQDILDAKLVIPSTAATEIARHAKDCQEVTLSILGESRNQLRVVCGNVTLTTRLIDSAYPNYEQVIPKQHNHRIEINAAELRMALNRARIVSTDAQPVMCAITADALTIKATSEQVGNGEEKVACELTGQPLTIAFKPQFLLDAISHLGCDRLAIETLGPLAPAIFRGVEDSADLGIVMPMRQ